MQRLLLLGADSLLSALAGGFCDSLLVSLCASSYQIAVCTPSKLQFWKERSQEHGHVSDWGDLETRRDLLKHLSPLKKLQEPDKGLSKLFSHTCSGRREKEERRLDQKSWDCPQLRQQLPTTNPHQTPARALGIQSNLQPVLWVRLALQGRAEEVGHYILRR